MSELFTVCRVIAQEPVGRVTLMGLTKAREPEDLARICRTIYVDPSALAGFPDLVLCAVCLHLSALACAHTLLHAPLAGGPIDMSLMAISKVSNAAGASCIPHQLLLQCSVANAAD